MNTLMPVISSKARNLRFSKTEISRLRLEMTRLIFWVLLAISLLASAPVQAEEVTALDSLFSGAEVKAAESKPLVLKMMVVNPSQKHKQVFPLKAYLPEEVLPDHILSKGELEVAYDSVKKAYYVQREIELDPGQSIVQEIKIQDVWQVPQPEMESVFKEAGELYGKLRGSRFEDQGRLLMENIKVSLIHIFESQTDTGVAPMDHISLFRENKKKLKEVETDIMALRRFLTMLAARESGLFGSKSNGNETLPAFFDKTGVRSTWSGGQVPGTVLWRVIFLVLTFLGLTAFLFVLVWNHQLHVNGGRQLNPASILDSSHQAIPVASELQMGDFIGSGGEDAAPYKPHPEHPEDAEAGGDAARDHHAA